MKNNLSPPLGDLEKTNVVYKFTCPLSHSQATEYIGFTQNTLSQRLTFHRQNGSIHDHFKHAHNVKPDRQHLINNTVIIGRATDRNKLAIKEALLILDRKPVINKQFDNFTNILKLHGSTHEYSTNQPKYTALQTTETSSFQLSPRTQHLITSPLKPILLNKEIPDIRPSHDQLNVPSPLTPQTQTDDPYETPNYLPIPKDLDSIAEEHDLNEDLCTLTPIDKITESNTFPDMEVVLRRFNINPDCFREVDIDSYNWNTFSTCDSPSFSPFISQRIKGLGRRARKK